MTQWTDVERFVIERWGEATALRAAVDQAEEKLEAQFEKMGGQLAESLKAKRFSVWVESAWAEISVYREAWVPKDEEDAVVYLTVGGLYPNGYRKVEDDRAYLCVDITGLRGAGLRGADRERFGEDLRRQLGDLLSGWRNEPEGRNVPICEYLDIDSEQRVKLMTDGEALHQFTVMQLERLLTLVDGIDATLRTVKGMQG